MAKAADLSQFQVNKDTAQPAKGQGAMSGTVRLKKKGVFMHPEAELQLDILKRKSGKKGPELLHEALNLLFKEYGMSTVEY